MVVYCNNEIDKVVYSGYTIDKIYACGGELVYGGNTPTVPPKWKERFEYTDGSIFYGGANFSTTETTAYTEDFANYVYTYDGRLYVYEYRSDYRGINAIQNNVSAVTINSGITSISANTFSGCSAITSANTIGCCGIDEIGDYAFKGCSAMTDTNVTYAAKNIGNGAFDHCVNLKEALFDYVETIGNSAFSTCKGTSFHRIVLPNTIKSIGYNAFRYCSNLRIVNCYATTPPTLGVAAFKNCHSELKIYVPNASVDAYKTASDWSSYADIIYPLT